MKGFAFIPAILVIFFLSAGSLGVYTISHSSKSPEKLSHKRASPSGSLVTIPFTPTPTPTLIKLLTNKLQPKVMSTPTPKLQPTVISILTPTSKPIENQIVSIENKTDIESISPSKVNLGESFTIKGKKLGSSTGSIWLFLPNSIEGNDSGITIDNWTDNEIRARATWVTGNHNLLLEVKTAGGERSNKVNFSIDKGQPIMHSISIPKVIGRQITIEGTDFGESPGEIRLYGPSGINSSNLAGICSISSWSYTTVVCTLPSSIDTDHGDYGVSLTTSDGRQASYLYIVICQLTGCG